MEALQFVPQLGKALWNLKVMYDQNVENGNEIKELQSFIQDYDHQIPILRERFQEGGSNVMGIAAFKSLERDVMEATNELERWSRNKSFFRVFNSTERMQKLGKMHSKVMASVQKNLGIANLSMLLDLQGTQATILESNKELKTLLITIIGSMHGTLPTEVRNEVVQASTSSFADPKFWEDVLAAVDNHNAGISLLQEKNMYEDPITSNLMIDPIVASDGNTYCRWTIIDNNLTRSPFNMDEDLTIVVDNLTFRRGLFEKFPEQAQIFRQRRNQHRSYALSLKAKGLWGDAILALHYILQWDKRDVECVEALKQVQRDLQEAKDKYLQPSVGPSSELGKGEPSGSSRSSMHEMVIGTRIELHEAYKLFPSLLSSIPEVQQGAAYGIYKWSKRDVNFQRYIVDTGGLPLLAGLLPSFDQITQERVLSVLLDISGSLHFKQFGLFEPRVERNFQDSLELIVEVLNKGSTRAREQAAKILFNLSTSSNGRSVIGKSLAMHALVTSLSNGTVQVQQIASSTLNNLFKDSLKPQEIREAGLVPILLRLIEEQPVTMLEEALPLQYELLNIKFRPVLHRVIQVHAPPTTWLKIMASESPVNQQRAACILYTLCHDDEEYCQQAKECQALEQIKQFTLPISTIKRPLIKLLDSNLLSQISVLLNNHTRFHLPFPKKDWWSPEKN